MSRVSALLLRLADAADASSQTLLHVNIKSARNLVRPNDDASSSSSSSNLQQLHPNASRPPSALGGLLTTTTTASTSSSTTNDIDHFASFVTYTWTGGDSSTTATTGPSAASNDAAVASTTPSLSTPTPFHSESSIVSGGANPSYAYSSSLSLRPTNSASLLSSVLHTPLLVQVYAAASAEQLAAVAKAARSSVPQASPWNKHADDSDAQPPPSRESHTPVQPTIANTSDVLSPRASPRASPFQHHSNVQSLDTSAASTTVANQSTNAASSSTASTSTPTPPAVAAERRAGILIGEVSISLASLLSMSSSLPPSSDSSGSASQTVIEGWFALTPAIPSAPSANYFAPDPDLGMPELFVPYALHQSQQPLAPSSSANSTAAAASSTNANAALMGGGAGAAGRASAPGTPERGSKRLTASRMGLVIQQSALNQAARDADNSSSSSAAAAAAAAGEYTLTTISSANSKSMPMEVYISIRLSRPLLSGLDLAASSLLTLSVDRVISLPGKWLQDARELDQEKERARIEADVQIGAWRKKKKLGATSGGTSGSGSVSASGASSTSSSSKKLGDAAGSPGPSSAGKRDKPSSSSGASANSANQSAAEKKRDKERLREAELTAQVDRLNHVYKYGLMLDVPVGQGLSVRVEASALGMELPSADLLTANGVGGSGTAASSPGIGPFSFSANSSVVGLDALALDSANSSLASGRSLSRQGSQRRVNSLGGTVGAAGSPQASSTAGATGAGTAAAGKASVASLSMSATASTNNIASSPASTSSNTAASAAGGGAPLGGLAGKAKKKAEDERLAREASDALELATERMTARLNARFIAISLKQTLCLTPSAMDFLAKFVGENQIPVHLWRELHSLDPAISAASLATSSTSSSSGAAIGTSAAGSTREVMKGVASLDLRSMLKPGWHEGVFDVSFKSSDNDLDPSDSRDGREARDRDEQPSPTSTAVEDAAVARSERRKSLTSNKKIRLVDVGKKRGDDLSPSPSPLPSAADPFFFARTSASIRLSVSRPFVPLIPKPRWEILDIIPGRKPGPLKKGPAEREVSEQVKRFVQELASEYAKIEADVRALDAENAAQSNNALEENDDGSDSSRRRDEVADAICSRLLYKLNADGSYQSLKERLKPILSKLYRDARIRDGDILDLQHAEPIAIANSSKELLAFDRRISRLYADMVDRAHVTLNELFHPSLHSAPSTFILAQTLPPPLQLKPDFSYLLSLSQSPSSLGVDLRSERSVQVQASVASSGTDAGTRLGVQAQEAEMQEDYPRAAVLHQSRCHLEYADSQSVGSEGSVNPSIAPATTAGYWYDYACFELRVHHFISARTALRYALSVCPSHAPSMLALAALSLDDGHLDLDSAEVLLRTYEQSVRSSSGAEGLPTSYFVMRAVYGERCDDAELASNARSAAQRAAYAQAATLASSAAASHLTHSASFETLINNGSNPLAAIAGTSPTVAIAVPDEFKYPSQTQSSGSSGIGSGSADPNLDVYVAASRYALGLGLVGLAEFVLNMDTKHGGTVMSHTKQIQYARMNMMRISMRTRCPHAYKVSAYTIAALYDTVESHLARAISLAPDDGACIEAFSLRGHSRWNRGLIDDAFDDYATYQDWEPQAQDPLLLYRMAHVYADRHEYAHAMDAYLELCRIAPSSVSWAGVARAEMMHNDERGGVGGDDVNKSIQAALIQSNIFDKTQAEVWARLAIVCITGDRIKLAHQSVMQMIKLYQYQTVPTSSSSPSSSLVLLSSLFYDLGRLYQLRGLPHIALDLHRRSQSIVDSARVRLGVAAAIIESGGMWSSADEEIDVAMTMERREREEKGMEEGGELEEEIQRMKRDIQQKMGR